MMIVIVAGSNGGAGKICHIVLPPPRYLAKVT